MRSPSLVFTRRLHALHELFSKSPRGKSIALRGKSLPTIENEVRLENGKGRTIATVKTIARLVEHLGPLSYLEKVPSENHLYTIVPLKTFRPSKKQDQFKRAGNGKELYITTSSDLLSIKHNVSKAYDFLSKGYRVEFHVRPRSNNRVQTIDWALQNALHLRPEVIQAAMPKGTKILIPPFRDGTALIWALEHPENWKKRFLLPRGSSGQKAPAEPSVLGVQADSYPRTETERSTPKYSHGNIKDRRSPINQSVDVKAVSDTPYSTPPSSTRSIPNKKMRYELGNSREQDNGMPLQPTNTLSEPSTNEEVEKHRVKSRTGQPNMLR